MVKLPIDVVKIEVFFLSCILAFGWLLFYAGLGNRTILFRISGERYINRQR